MSDPCYTSALFITSASAHIKAECDRFKVRHGLTDDLKTIAKLVGMKVRADGFRHHGLLQVVTLSPRSKNRHTELLQACLRYSYSVFSRSSSRTRQSITKREVKALSCFVFR